MKSKGFEIIEVMVVVAIVGLLLAVIVPQVTEGKKALKLGMSVSEYREYTERNKIVEEEKRLRTIEQETKNKLWK